MKKIFALLFLFMMMENISAQRKVQSKSYNVVLRKLLKHSVPEITIDSLSKIINTVTLFDAREENEYDISHLRQAKFVGYNTFKIDSVSHLKKDAPIVVYCSVGFRSEKISEKLIQDGFTNVSNLYGGIFEWKNKNLDVFNDDGVTQNIHPYSKTWGLWLKKGKKKYR